MPEQPKSSRPDRRMERRIERRGLRPRDAAYLVAAFRAAAVVVFGVLERIADPKTFLSVWLGMWWAVETVTTVGYGDVVPDQTAGKLGLDHLPVPATPGRFIQQTLAPRRSRRTG